MADPLKIQIGFSRSSGLISSLIAWATRSQVSHAFVVIDHNVLGPLVFQSNSRGPTLTTLAEFKSQHTIVDMVDPVIDLTDALTICINNTIGESYDYTGVLGMAIVLIGRWLHTQWKNIFHDKNHQFCSELIVWLLQLANYPGADKLIADETTPEDLLEFLKPSGRPPRHF